MEGLGHETPRKGLSGAERDNHVPVCLHDLGHHLLAADKSHRVGVERQLVKARSELGGERLQPVERAFGFKRSGIALESDGCAEDAGASAGGFLSQRGCGAVSVPRKNFGLPETAAARSASRWLSRFATGKQ